MTRGQVNIDFRHGARASAAAGALYADGHAAPLTEGDWALATLPWGGSSLMRRALQRLEDKDALSARFIGQLRAADISGAGQLWKTNRKALQPTVDGIVALWLLNHGEETSEGEETSPSAGTSESVDQIGWHLARALESVGEGTVRQTLEGEMGRRANLEWDRAQAAGSQSWTTSSNYALSLPSNWTQEEQAVGRYHRTYLRSALPSVFALVEIGDRQSYTEAKPVDWDGMERDLKGRYGNGYHSLRREPAHLNGQLASVWEYEIEKAGSPRLRKLTIGYASGWQSCVLALTAPARDFEKWRPVFQQAMDSLRAGSDAQ